MSLSGPLFRALMPLRSLSGVSPLGYTSRRWYSTEPPADLDDYEKMIFTKLQNAFEPSALQVRDVSGGCGSMFAISVVSDKFSGVPMIKQHRMVNEALADEIKKWHGLQLRTKAK